MIPVKAIDDIASFFTSNVCKSWVSFKVFISPSLGCELEREEEKISLFANLKKKMENMFTPFEIPSLKLEDKEARRK